MSARTPQTSEPATVPVKATKGSMAAAALVSPYSLATPGTTKPSVAGFMVSMIRAKASTTISMTCWPFRGADSSVSTTISRSLAIEVPGGGKRPKAATTVPAMISAMPNSMPGSIGMPAIW